MLKVAWGLISKEHALWAQVLQSKYKMDLQDYDYNPNGRNASNLWKGISSVWMALRDCVRWEIGNGNMVRFWMDEWLQNGVKLMEIANAGTSSENETLK